MDKPAIALAPGATKTNSARWAKKNITKKRGRRSIDEKKNLPAVAIDTNIEMVARKFVPSTPLPPPKERQQSIVLDFTDSFEGVYSSGALGSDTTLNPMGGPKNPTNLTTPKNTTRPKRLKNVLHVPVAC